MKKNLRVENRKLRVGILLIVCLQTVVITGCEDFVKVDVPKNEIASEAVFTSDASATSAIRGIYSLMVTNQSFTNGEAERFLGLYADELTNYSTSQNQIQFYTNSLATINTNVLNIFWKEAFKYINNANGVLEGLQKSSKITEATRKQLEGEAKFIRAFCNFYLVNLFGDVPLISVTDYRVNSVATRTPKGEVYSKILTDLEDAQSLLAEDFSFSKGERIQPNKGAATAMLARVHLYLGNWADAEAQATTLIDNSTTYSLEPSLDNVFLGNSMEAIWQLKPVMPGANTSQARIFLLTNRPSSSLGRVSLSNTLYNSFEVDDDRKTSWIGAFTHTASGVTYYYPNKYKVYSTEEADGPPTEYSMILRLAEQYLIRAEARAQQDKLAEAIADIDAIRYRAGLPLLQETNPSIDQPGLLIAIEQERKVELFVEWGHRWFDLVRTDGATDVLETLKTDWEPTDVLFPIPESERLINPKLGQNGGY